MKRGKFIVFEGIDYCGKTTQARLLREKLLKDGNLVILTREPGEQSIPACASMRNMLTNRKEYKVDSRTAILLMIADRACHVENLIRKALEDGITVICDRYYYSTLAYQQDSFFDFRTLVEMNLRAVGGLEPDKIIYLDITDDVLEERRNNSGRTMETNDDLSIDKFKKIRENYDRAFTELYEHSNIVSYILNDGTRTENQISEKIYKIVKNIVNNDEKVVI